jgi:hypothetical protein
MHSKNTKSFIGVLRDAIKQIYNLDTFGAFGRAGHFSGAPWDVLSLGKRQFTD